MRFFIFIFCFHFLFLTFYCFKLRHRGNEEVETTRYKNLESLADDRGNTLNDRNFEDDEIEEEDREISSLDGTKSEEMRDLDEAKRNEEIRSIRRTLKRKIEVYFRSIHPEFRKSEMCLSNMADGVNFNSIDYLTTDWRKIIKGAISMAGGVVKTALGPFAGPSKVALKGLAGLTNFIGKKKKRMEDYLPSTTPPPVILATTRDPWAKLDQRPLKDNDLVQSSSWSSDKANQQLLHQLHSLELRIRTQPSYYSNMAHDDYFSQEMLERFIQEFCDDEERILEN